MKAYRKNKVPQIVFGCDTAKDTGKELENLCVTKCLIVTDKGVRGAGIVDPILKSLEEHGDSGLYHLRSPWQTHEQEKDGICFCCLFSCGRTADHSVQLQYLSRFTLQIHCRLRIRNPDPDLDRNLTGLL